MDWLSFGMNMVGGFLNYQADKESAKARRAWQAYNNTMARLSDAVNQNAITTNEILSEQAYAEQAIGIKQSNILTQAQAEVTAAAAGVKGVSVDDVVRDINRNAAVAENQRQINLSAARLAFDQQRLGSALGAQNAQDLSFIPKPKLGSYLLGAAMSSIDTSINRKQQPSVEVKKPNKSPSLDWSSPQSLYDSTIGWINYRF